MSQLHITKTYLRVRFFSGCALIIIAAALSHQLTLRTFHDVLGKVADVHIFEELKTVLIESSSTLEGLDRVDAIAPLQSKLYQSSLALVGVVENIRKNQINGSFDANTLDLLDNADLDLLSLLDNFHRILTTLANDTAPSSDEDARLIQTARSTTDQILPIIARMNAVELQGLDRTNRRLLRTNDIAFITMAGLLILVGLLVYRPMERRIINSHEDLRKKQKQAEATSIAKSQFLANMSHEIRTPMNGVLGMAEVLNTTDLTPDQHDMLRVISDSGKSLMAIIEDILDFSRIEAKKNILEIASFDFRSMSTHLHRLFEPTATAKDVRLIWIEDDQIAASLLGDKDRIQQILTNLVGNALKFTTEGSVIVKIAASSIFNDTQHLSIQVQDSGVGIDESQVERIFQQFEQADTPSTHKFGGTGLGLAISSALANEMGGKIEVVSKLGRGSTFTFSIALPVYDQHGSTPTAFETIGLQ